MKSHKRFLFILLALALLGGCGSDNENLPENALNGSSTGISENGDLVDPNAFSFSDGIDENGFWEGITALDYVELFNYQAMPIPSNIHQVPAATLQEEINGILSYYATGEQVMDRAVVDGDTVNIDYVGSVDGVEFDGGNTMGMGTDVTIGVTSYIDDFLEQLIGHTPGETINVEVTFPDVYQEPSLQGQDAVFVTTINYITEMGQPELTDEFVMDNLSAAYGWETVADMKEEITAVLQEEAVQQYINEYMNSEVAVHSVPEEVSQYQEEAMLQYYRDGAEYYGMDFEEFLVGYTGTSSTDELIEMNRESNLQNAMYALVVQAVAEDAEIMVSEEDVYNYFTDYASYEAQYGLPYLKQIVLYQKVLNHITDNAVFE